MAAERNDIVAPRSIVAPIPMTGMLSTLEITRASVSARKEQVPLARWLMNQGMPRADMELILAAHYGCPVFHPDARTAIPQPLLRQLRPEFLRQICAVPLNCA